MQDFNPNVDSEISLLLSRVADLRTYRNEHAPISTLPLELLVEIFWNVIRSTFWTFGSKTSIALIRLGFVCRQWHAVIRDNARLWSLLDLTSNERMKNMRSWQKDLS